MKKQKENSLGNITWPEMGKQNVQAKEVNYCENWRCKRVNLSLIFITVTLFTVANEKWSSIELYQTSLFQSKRVRVRSGYEISYAKDIST